MRRRTRLFLRESVILFGFLNGLFLSLGVNPARTILGVVQEMTDSLTGGNGALRLALTILPLALLLLMLVLIHRRAGWLGFLAVGLAFLAGLWLLAAPTIALVVLLAALGLGIVATR